MLATFSHLQRSAWLLSGRDACIKMSKLAVSNVERKKNAQACPNWEDQEGLGQRLMKHLAPLDSNFTFINLNGDSIDRPHRRQRNASELVLVSRCPMAHRVTYCSRCNRCDTSGSALALQGMKMALNLAASSSAILVQRCITKLQHTPVAYQLQEESPQRPSWR